MSRRLKPSEASGKTGSKKKADQSRAGGSFLKVSGKSGNNLSKMSTRASRRLRSSSRSGSRRKKKKEDVARVYDEKGMDVTPKPLVQNSDRVGYISQVDSGSANASFTGEGGNLGSRTRSGMSSQSGSDVDMDNASDREFEKEEGGEEAEGVAAKTPSVAVAPEDDETPEKLTAADLEEMIVIKLEESSTLSLLKINSSRVWEEDTEAAKAAQERNDKYDSLLEKRKTEADKYTTRHSQTFNNTTRHKLVQNTPHQTTNTGAQAYTFEIYDFMQEKEETKGEEGTEQADGTSSGQTVDLLNTKSDLEMLYQNENFATAMSTLEQAVIQNEIHAQQLLYRNHEKSNNVVDESERLGVVSKVEETLKDTENTKQPPHLVKLWSYACPLIADRNVSCMCFNKQNKDLLCVGYGEFSFGNTERGVILFWSLKNPQYPVKILNTKSSVVSLDFCTEHPSLLAVGLYDGSVLIYDIRDDNDKPALESAHATGKHSEAVWGVRWIQKEPNKPLQVLMSISSDGTVQQWSMKKGLIPDEKLQLKRTPNKVLFQGSHMEGISREASGLCFDFSSTDGTTYYAGTEDGIIHKCSASYNEQTLFSYYCHTGPVYKVRMSPFLPDAFLSCSADWRAALFSERQSDPLMVFQSGYDYVMDIQWSPQNSCMFASVSRDSRVEVWDLEASPLDPVIQHDTGKELSCVIFSPDSPVILVGATDGSIDVYRILGVNSPNGDETWSAERQAQRLNEAMYLNNETKSGSTLPDNNDNSADANSSEGGSGESKDV